MLSKKYQKELLPYLTLRQCGGDQHSKNLRVIARNLLLSANTSMELRWSKETNKDIKYNDHIFFNDFTEVRDYTGKLLYKLAPPRHGDKIIEIVRCELSIASRPSRGKIFALTKKNCLRIYDIQTGQLLTDLSLGAISYKHLCWESYLETIALKATIAPNPQMVVFEAEPRRLLYKFSVPGNVFGPNLRAAYVLNGMLYILRGKDEIVCYHLSKVLQPYEIAGYRERLSKQNFAEAVCGGPTHIFDTAEKLPSPILHVRSKDHFLDFGGFPLSIVTWLAEDNSYSLRPVEIPQQTLTKALARVRPPQQTLFADEQPSVVWHDNQWRLMVHNCDSLAVYSLKRSREMLTASSRSLHCDFAIFARDPNHVVLNPKSENGIEALDLIAAEALQKKEEEADSPQKNKQTETVEEKRGSEKSALSSSSSLSTKFVSQSGRETTLRFGAFQPLSAPSHFHSVTYEDELDLLTVTIGGHVHLYDNRSGRLLRTFVLHHWHEKFENQVILDKFNLYHLVSAPGKKCAAYVYEWTRAEDNRLAPHQPLNSEERRREGEQQRGRRRRRGRRASADSSGEEDESDGDGEYLVTTGRRRRG